VKLSNSNQLVTSASPTTRGARSLKNVVVVAMSLAATLCSLATPGSSAAAAPVTTAATASTAQDQSWLTIVNEFRAVAGVSPVAEDPARSLGAVAHSCYMLQNGITHVETVGSAGYTAVGAAAGMNGNVAVASNIDQTDRAHIELWMAGPFHALGIIRPALKTVGFGACRSATSPKWHSAATLDVLHGVALAASTTEPVFFPGDKSTVVLDRFHVETPDPLEFCGWAGTPAGLPIIALSPEAIATNPVVSLTGPTGPIETCGLSSLNTSGIASDLLEVDRAVVVIPRHPLTPGVYVSTVVTQSRTMVWSFTIDPEAANSPAPTIPVPVATAVPAGGPLGFVSQVSTRLVDSREGLGATRLTAQVAQRVDFTSPSGIPIAAQAISANFTVTGSAGPGYLTVWNCAAERPLASTVNFGTGEAVPNASSVPLDADGGACFFSSAEADIVVDVNGFYAPAVGDGFSPLTPVRLLDTRIGSSVGRLRAGQTVALQVAGVGSLPASVRTAVLNVTSVDAAAAGYVTVFPCDAGRPFTSGLNPVPGRVRPNMAIAPLSADGKVCLYSSVAVDLIVDATGYLDESSSSSFTPTVPFRFTDTRVTNQPQLDAGTGGARVSAGQMVTISLGGVRGIPSDATAVSVNIAAVSAVGSGFVTAFPCGTRPNTSNVNYEANDPVSNGSQLALSTTGTLCIFTLVDAHVIIDVNGWWS